MIGPNVTIATAGHPLDAELRKKGMQFNKSVHIGNGVWLGSGVIILPVSLLLRQLLPVHIF